jgi:CubicO group peptidase (beta-lactamase class C family)
MIIEKLIGSSYLARYFLLNAVDITDYKVFPAREIQNSPPTFNFIPTGRDGGITTLLDKTVQSELAAKSYVSLEQFLAENGTTAFLIIHHDQLLVEKYYNGYSRTSICTSFSTVKSFVSALIGIALDEGLIYSLDDPITRYLSGLPESQFTGISIRHLISMCSGLSYKQGSFLPWSDDPRVYYSLDLRMLAQHAKMDEQPGIRFNYNNYNLVLLGMLLEKVTGNTVSYYLQEKIWKPLGMEFPACWSLDSRKSGMEKMESGLNARAIDYAKFACLFLHKGDWNSKQVLPERWVAESTTVEPEAKWTNYKYLWWILRSGQNRFMAVGNLGQFIYIAPDRDCIILRFGRGKPSDWHKAYVTLFNAIAEALSESSHGSTQRARS